MLNYIRSSFGMSVVVLVGFIMCNTVFAEADGPDYWQLKDGVSASLYKEPILNSSIITTLAKGTSYLKNHGCQGIPSYTAWSQLTEKQRTNQKNKGWCNVEFNGMWGWIPLRLLTEQTKFNPNFSCHSNKLSSIEKLICSDTKLAILDQELQSVYTRVLKIASSLDSDAVKTVKTLKTIQRGWYKGRDDCWKETNQKQCTKDAYERRIVELSAYWRLVPIQNPGFYHCTDRAEIVVTVANTPYRRSVLVEYGDKTVVFIANDEDHKYDGPFGKLLTLDNKNAYLTWDQNVPEKHCVKVQ